MINGPKLILVKLLNIKFAEFQIIIGLNINFYFLGISYCGVALRYVTKDFELFTFILGCFPYNAATQSAQHLREFVNKILEDYKLVLDSTKFVVTDNEAKMLAAFKEQCFRIGCADHYFKKQLQHAFQSEKIYSNKNTFDIVGCELAQTIFNHVKE